MSARNVTIRTKRRIRMSQMDYLMVCAREVLEARGNKWTPPRFCWELRPQGNFDLSVQIEAEQMVMEMFGLTE